MASPEVRIVPPLRQVNLNVGTSLSKGEALLESEVVRHQRHERVLARAVFAGGIALEELRNVGAEVFIRVGSAGGRRKEIPIGSLVVVTAAYRGDGVSDEYLPLGFPAVADLDVNNALIQAAKELGFSAFTGIGTTRSAYYVRHPELNEHLRQVGVVAAEMEASTLFIVGTRRQAKVGCVVATDSNIYLEKQPTLAEKEALYMQGEQMTIRTALRAVQLLEVTS